MTEEDIRTAAKNIEQRFLDNDVIAPAQPTRIYQPPEDNVATALCTYLDNRSDCPEQGTDYRGWKPWVADAVDELSRKLQSIAEQEIRKILGKNPKYSAGLCTSAIARTVRIIERKFWRRIDMEHLEKGDIFRVFELDTEGNLHLAKTDAGNEEARAIESPFIDPEYGVWSVAYEETD